jgi:hypothetical protein
VIESGKMRLFNVMACSIEAFRMIEASVLDGERSEFHPELAKEHYV